MVPAFLPVVVAQEEDSGPSANTTIIAVCVVAGVVAVLFVVGALVVCIRKRRARKPRRHRHSNNPYGQMESPQLAAEFDSVPRGRAGGQQPSTMYHDLTRAISDIFGDNKADKPQPQGHYASHSQLSLGGAHYASHSQLNLAAQPHYASHSQLSLDPRSQNYASRSQLSVAGEEPSVYASKTSLTQPDPVYMGSTTSLNDPSKGYHYKRRQHSDELCTLSKPMSRRSVSDAPFRRVLPILLLGQSTLGHPYPNTHHTHQHRPTPHPLPNAF